MEQYSEIIPGTASYCGLDAKQHSSTATESHYESEISGAVGDLDDLPSVILSDKNYRVVAGRLYVIRPGSPPNSKS